MVVTTVSTGLQSLHAWLNDRFDAQDCVTLWVEGDQIKGWLDSLVLTNEDATKVAVIKSKFYRYGNGPNQWAWSEGDWWTVMVRLDSVRAWMAMSHPPPP